MFQGVLQSGLLFQNTTTWLASINYNLMLRFRQSGLQVQNFYFCSNLSLFETKTYPYTTLQFSIQEM